jgi:hypothetical protein
MKKTLISLAAASLVASSAFAADKGIDIDVGGQAVLYYETHDSNTPATEGMFDNSNSTAAGGVQLDLGADLGNNFTFGSQISVINSLGLENSSVAALKQTTNTTGLTTDELALTKIFVAKKIGNTTLKLGRQELPKSLSPLAYSEGWNVFKNTFDAIVAINSDIPKTTLVGAYVGNATGMGLGNTADIGAVTNAGTLAVTKTAYMITAQTTAIPMTTLTGSYYSLSGIGSSPVVAANTTFSLNTSTGAIVGNAASNGVKGIHADAYWVDAQIKPMDILTIGLQGGQISPDSMLTNQIGGLITMLDDTNAYGVKVNVKPIPALSLTGIYTSVDGNDNAASVAVKNTGTGIKSPLYSQMMYNQNMISQDADTYVVKAAYSMGDMGTVGIAYGMTEMGQNNTAANPAVWGQKTDYNELDITYKVKAGGVQYFAIAAIRDIDAGGVMNSTVGNVTATPFVGGDKDTVLRFWARYNF